MGSGKAPRQLKHVTLNPETPKPIRYPVLLANQLQSEDDDGKAKTHGRVNCEPRAANGSLY